MNHVGGDAFVSKVVRSDGQRFCSAEYRETSIEWYIDIISFLSRSFEPATFFGGERERAPKKSKRGRLTKRKEWGTTPLLPYWQIAR